jgi:hypothetical protein
MPCVLVQRAEIACIEDRDVMQNAEFPNLIGGMMQGITGYALDFLAQTAPCAVETLAPSRSGLRAAPLFLELGQPFGPTLFDGS